MSRPNRFLLVCITLVALFSIGRFAGFMMATGIEMSVLPIGGELPLVIVNSETLDPLDLRTLLATDHPTVITIAQDGCDPCIDDALDWRHLHEEFGETRSFIGLVCGGDLDSFREFRERTRLGYETYLCDAALLGLLAPRSPTIYEIGPGGRVAFSALGSDSSDDLRHHLNLTISEQDNE